MALSSLTSNSGATVSSTGGTSDPLLVTGSDLKTMNMIYSDDVNAVARKIAFSVKPAQVSAGAPGGYTQNRRTVYYTSPLVLDNGASTVNSIKIEFAADPETTDAELQLMLEDIKQILVSTTVDDFINDLAVG
jgi:hypothetical protein